MKNWIPRWFESKTEKEARDDQAAPPLFRSSATTDELEQRLISEADAWVRQYEQPEPSPDVQLRSQRTEYDARFPGRPRNRQWIQILAILAVSLVIVLGVWSWRQSTPQQARSVSQDKTQQEDSRPSDLELRSLVASARAVDEIVGKVMVGFRRLKNSPRPQQVDDHLASSLANAAEHLKQPGRQYGRTLAWIEHHLQLLDAPAVNNPGDKAD